MDVAFLGTGIMGSRMAANLAKAGHNVTVWNRTPEKAAPLAEFGCKLASSPRSAVRGAQVVFTMVADPVALRQVAIGSQGFLDELPPGTLWVDHSTVDPATSRQMGANAVNRGLRFLDVPVSGSSGAAGSAKLIFFAGGELSDIEGIRVLLEAMGSRIVHAGPIGAGSSLKLVNNLFLAQAQVAWSETLGLATRIGLTEEIVHEAILPTHVAPGFLTFKRAKIENREWSPEFPLKHALKDVRLALEMAVGVGLELSQARASEALYKQAARQGMGDQDISSVHEIASKGHLTPETGALEESAFRG
ncbi:MAG: NAD(P)-dependent oxidoreductase [Fibrobacterota bacterium]|nr:NAD(P)-dependent oxidoreductase [Fibrobacterota bacterium]QQS06687.1 MAG: NAD(P)-dependent oxidoreductase [Fibrobacterota bacterium]